MEKGRGGQDMDRMLEQELQYPNFLDIATRETDPKFREDHHWCPNS